MLILPSLLDSPSGIAPAQDQINRTCTTKTDWSQLIVHLSIDKKGSVRMTIYSAPKTKSKNIRSRQPIFERLKIVTAGRLIDTQPELTSDAQGMVHKVGGYAFVDFPHLFRRKEIELYGQSLLGHGQIAHHVEHIWRYSPGMRSSDRTYRGAGSDN